MSKITYQIEDKGQLPFMVTWQSKDGRVEAKYFDSWPEARKQALWLETIGRMPKIYHEVIEYK